MIILDTNVVSELMKPAPSKPVIGWMALQAATSLYTTSTTDFEDCGVKLINPWLA